MCTERITLRTCVLMEKVRRGHVLRYKRPYMHHSHTNGRVILISEPLLSQNRNRENDICKHNIPIGSKALYCCLSMREPSMLTRRTRTVSGEDGKGYRPADAVADRTVGCKKAVHTVRQTTSIPICIETGRRARPGLYWLQ